MGMQNSDDEEEIGKQHAMEEAYRRTHPWDVPRQDASELEQALWSDKVRRVMTPR